MTELFGPLKDKKDELEKIVRLVGKKVVDVPEGRLALSKQNGEYKYYFEDPAKQGKRIYIKKKDRPFAMQLAQNDYNQKLLLLSKKRLKEINKILQTYQDSEVEDLYEKMCPGRKALIDPFVQPLDEFIKEWEKHEYPIKHPVEIKGENYTKKGEHVRSRAEKILADMFYDAGILYKYEEALYYNGRYFLYPDFTILNKRTRKTIYWEHMGMMEKSDYKENQIDKINKYYELGIIPGENLVFSGQEGNFSTKQELIKHQIEKYLL